MPFFSFLEDNQSYEVRMHHGANEWIHTVTLGNFTDEEENLQINLHVGMQRDPPYEVPRNSVELMFFIGLLPEHGNPRSTFDARETKQYLQGVERSNALRVICLETKKMLQIAKPDVVTMSTVQGDLPAKALRKYQAICAAIIAAGYTGGEADPYKGDHIWMFVNT